MTETKKFAETIYVGHMPNTYKAYKTIGGWVINFLDRENNLRPADGGKIYKSSTNAYTRVARLNHPIRHALKKKTGICEAWWDRYTLVVREDENERFEAVFNLSISVEAMPPHYSQDFPTVDAVEEELRERSQMPLYLDWTAVKTEA